MRAARAWSVPLSVFAGERDPGGRWSSRDRLLAVALLQLEAQLCSGCGYPQWLAFDPTLGWETPDDPHRCHPCTARDRAAGRWSKSNDEDSVEQPGALRWSVEPHHPNPTV